MDEAVIDGFINGVIDDFTAMGTDVLKGVIIIGGAALLICILYCLAKIIIKHIRRLIGK